MDLVKTFGISLALTLILELPVAWFFGMRDLKLAVLVNVLTNPAAVLLHLLGIPQIPIEIGVVLVEWAVYRSFASEENWHIRHPAALAIVANGISWMVGVLLQR